MHQLVIKGFSIVDARCNHEVYDVLSNAKLSFFYISAAFKIQLLPALASSTDSRKKANNFGPTLQGLFTCNMKEVCDDRYAELYRSRMAVTGDISLTFGFHDNKRRLDWLRKSTVSMFRLSLHCEEGKCYDFYSVFMKAQNTIYKKKIPAHKSKFFHVYFSH